MADNIENKLMALEHLIIAVVKALEEKKIFERGEITKQLHSFEESLRDLKVTESADVIRELRKRLG